MGRPKLILRLLEWLLDRKQPSGSQKIGPSIVGDSNIVINVTININDGRNQ